MTATPSTDTSSTATIRRHQGAWPPRAAYGCSTRKSTVSMWPGALLLEVSSMRSTSFQRPRVTAPIQHVAEHGAEARTFLRAHHLARDVVDLIGPAGTLDVTHQVAEQVEAVLLGGSGGDTRDGAPGDHLLQKVELVDQ